MVISSMAINTIYKDLYYIIHRITMYALYIRDVIFKLIYQNVFQVYNVSSYTIQNTIHSM